MTVARLSPTDVDFLQRLHQLQQRNNWMVAGVSPTRVVADSIDKEPIWEQLERRREQWDFDGSVVIGRVDTSDSRYYVGTRRVLDTGTPVLFTADDPVVQSLWSSSEQRPGLVVLKRHLDVQGWDLVGSMTEFDHRDSVEDQGPTAPEAAKGHGPAPHAALVALQEQARDALDDALLELALGRVVGNSPLQALQAWNAALLAAARQEGLPSDGSAPLDDVLAAAQQRESTALRDAISALEQVVEQRPDWAHDVAVMVRRLSDGLPSAARPAIAKIDEASP